MRTLERIIKNQLVYLLVFLIGLGFWILPLGVMASHVFLSSDKDEVPNGATFKVTVYVNAVEERVNTIEGKLVYDNEKIILERIDETDSIIGIWVSRPEEEKKGSVYWSGIIPGGFEYLLKPLDSNKYPGVVVSFVFRAVEEGQVNIGIEDGVLYLHDGEGTQHDFTLPPLEINITASGDNPITGEDIVEDDLEPPEPIDVLIGENQDMFDGKYFIAFNTKDLKSGVDYFEVRETGFDWVRAESPYLLQNQRLSNKIIVKAVDRAGNARFATTSIRLLKSDNGLLKILLSIIVIIILVFTGRFLYGKMKGIKSP